MQSIYETVTAKIVAELEQGTAPWVKPWTGKGGSSDLPSNAATGRPYSGVNVLLLWGAAIEKGYTQGKWLTFRQAHTLGAHVRKGERAEHIVFASQAAAKEENSAEENRTYRFLKFHAVFNVTQVDDLPAAIYQVSEPRALPDSLHEADRFITAIGATVRHGGSRAAYAPEPDIILLPSRECFETDGHYIATSLHEHGHWTGHTSRLGRDLRGRFGDASYAAEELVAELTAAFLCAHLGAPGKLRHPEYIASWLQVLKSDMRAIFTAAGKATAAANYMRKVAESDETSQTEAAEAAT